MSFSRSMRRAVAAGAVLAVGAAAVGVSPASAAPGPPATKAYVNVPAGRAFPAGDYSIAASDVTITGGADNLGTDVAFDVNMGSGTPFVLSLTAPTGGSFGTTQQVFTGVTDTATATKPGMTLTRTGSTCNNPTGDVTIDSASFGDDPGGTNAGPPFDVLTMVLSFSITCSGDSATSASGFAFVNQPLGPLGTSGAQAGEFISMAPKRLYDSRLATKLGPAGEVDVDITSNSSGVPTDAVAVVVNVTGVAPSADTFLTVYPKGATRPTVSNLNPRKDDTTANLATVKVGTANKITVYNQLGNTDVVVDVVGYYALDNAAAGGGRFTSQAPVRKLDTRDTGMTKLAEGETRVVDLGITADAAVINVTVTNPTKGGYLTVFPESATAPPLASNLNFVATQTIANLVMVKADAGKIKLYNPAGTTDVVIDLLGTFSIDPDNSDGAGRFVAVDPVRAYDSRDTGNTKLADNETRDVNLLWLTDKYPFEYSAVVANMTAVDTTEAGYFTAFPASETTRPFASNLNWLAGEVRPNLIVAGTDADGFSSFYADSPANLVLDVAGYFTTAGQPKSP